MMHFMKQDWITNHIKQIGKKKKDLATALGLPHTRISEIIAGKRQLKVSEVDIFATFMEITRDQVLAKFSMLEISGSIIHPSSNEPRLSVVSTGFSEKREHYQYKKSKIQKELEKRLLENFRTLNNKDRVAFLKMSEVYANKKK